MTAERFTELLRVTGNITPEGLEQYIGDLSTAEKELLPRERLQYVLDLNHVPDDKQRRLFSALDEANAIPELVELSHIMALDAVRALNRCTACEFTQPKPDCLQGFAKEAFGFLFSQMLVLEGRKQLRARGIPEKYDLDIPERMTRRAMGKYVATGDINFDDFPWDVNFFCCDIFLLDRFYFIPYLWPDTPTAWRNAETNEVIALWKGGDRVRRDGQLDGVNGITDPAAFTTEFRETEASVTGNPVRPDGYILKDPVTLDRAVWKKALSEGDYLLALHIPGGEGYAPERVRKSCETALDFFDRYYPEYRYIGFWSESWLYDPGLAAILGPERNISRVSRQFYCYPTLEGDTMARAEVLHDPNADYHEFKARTALEKGMFAAWDRGERFHTTGMFLLREEVKKVGADPYRKGD